MPPIMAALLLQLLALLLALVLAWLMDASLLLLAGLCGGLAALFSYLARLARWWLWIQLFFVPLLLLVLALQLPAWWFLVLFAVLVLVYWSTFLTQVPLYLSSRQVWLALERLLPPDSGSFVDLGCGLGGVLHWLATRRVDMQFDGVELAPLPFWFSRWRLRHCDNVSVRRADMWQLDLSGYRVVFAYLSPVPMAQLWLKVQQEMSPGSLFISSSFEVPGQYPDQVIELDDLHGTRLLVWRI